MIVKDEIGKEFVINSGCDLSGLTTAVIKISKPNGIDVDWIPQTIGTNSITYKTQAGDLDQAGKYRIKRTVYTFATGDVFMGQPVDFIVSDYEV